MNPACWPGCSSPATLTNSATGANCSVVPSRSVRSWLAELRIAGACSSRATMSRTTGRRRCRWCGHPYHRRAAGGHQIRGHAVDANRQERGSTGFAAARPGHCDRQHQCRGQHNQQDPRDHRGDAQCGPVRSGSHGVFGDAGPHPFVRRKRARQDDGCDRANESTAAAGVVQGSGATRRARGSAACGSVRRRPRPGAVRRHQASRGCQLPHGTQATSVTSTILVGEHATGEAHQVVMDGRSCAPAGRR